MANDPKNPSNRMNLHFKKQNLPELIETLEKAKNALATAFKLVELYNTDNGARATKTEHTAAVDEMKEAIASANKMIAQYTVRVTAATKRFQDML